MRNWISLYPHQRDALEDMHNGCILCGGVGSGKSRTALAYFYREQGGVLYSQTFEQIVEPCDLYIITPAKKRDTGDWQREMAMFCIPNDKCSVVVDSWNNIGKYTTVSHAFFIFDEQRVIGSGAWVRAFYKITKNNRWILLTATPGDDWSDYIPVFVANGFYRNKTDFNDQHVIFNRFTKWPQIDKYVGLKKLEECRNRVLVVMNYQKEAMCFHHDIVCNYDRDTYRWIYRNRCDPETHEPFMNASAMMYALRRIVFGDESRVTKLIQIVTEHKRVIVFYNLDCELDILRSIQWPEGVEYAEYNGHKHQDYPTSRYWVYACQYNSCSEAWECTDTNCMVFYSNNYSYKTMVQAAGRIDRNNTPYSELYYYHLVSKSPLDLAIMSKLSSKKKFNEKAFLGKEICDSFERRQK